MDLSSLLLINLTAAASLHRQVFVCCVDCRLELEGKCTLPQRGAVEKSVADLNSETWIRTHSTHVQEHFLVILSFFLSHEQISFVPKITAEPSEESVHMLSSEVFKLCFLGMDLKRRRSESCTIITVGFHNHYIHRAKR